MSTPFMGELRIMSFGFAPRGWAFANGQLLPINQNQALFSLLGTTYGGNGQTTFGLPNLQGRVPIHQGNNFTLGQVGGEQAHTLSIAEMPTHSHVAQASSAVGNTFLPTNNLLAKAEGVDIYQTPSNLVSMSPSSMTNVGGSQAHLNLQPFLTLNFCIALQGIFPSQN